MANVCLRISDKLDVHCPSQDGSTIPDEEPALAIYKQEGTAVL